MSRLMKRAIKEAEEQMMSPNYEPEKKEWSTKEKVLGGSLAALGIAGAGGLAADKLTKGKDGKGAVTRALKATSRNLNGIKKAIIGGLALTGGNALLEEDHKLVKSAEMTDKEKREAAGIGLTVGGIGASGAGMYHSYKGLDASFKRVLQEEVEAQQKLIKSHTKKSYGYAGAGLGMSVAGRMLRTPEKKKED